MKRTSNMIDKPKRLITGQILAIILGVVLVGVSIVWATFAAGTPVALEAESGTVTSPVTVVNDAAASGGKGIKFGAASTSCTISTLLVNSCRPWIGAAANNYAVGGGFRANMEAHEARIGRKLDVVHNYHTPGQVMSADDIYFAGRANTILLMNWKPAQTWSDAGGGNATVNSQIDAMADSIKSVAPAKIMLVIFHEPENDVSPGGEPTCPNLGYKGSSGTTADYVNMWQNTRHRFDAKGVSNVVWTMNYMGFSGWDCLVKPMWPGNSYVDWIVWDPYGSDFNSTINRFYTWMAANGDASHDFNSKPWGIGEYGATGTQAQAYKFYDDARAAVVANTYPKMKLWTIWDNLVGTSDFRVQYSTAGVLDQIEQDHYNAFVNDANLK